MALGQGRRQTPVGVATAPPDRVALLAVNRRNALDEAARRARRILKSTTARPQPCAGRLVFASIKIGELAVSPVVQPFAIAARAGWQPLPGRIAQTSRDRLGGAGQKGLSPHEPKG